VENDGEGCSWLGRVVVIVCVSDMGSIWVGAAGLAEEDEDEVTDPELEVGADDEDVAVVDPDARDGTEDEAETLVLVRVDSAESGIGRKPTKGAWTPLIP
jgi:hypothetical protein